MFKANRIYLFIIIFIAILLSIQTLLIINNLNYFYFLIPIILTVIIAYFISQLVTYKDELLENQKLLESIIENDNSGIAIINYNGVFKFSSNILNNILEYELNELNGTNIIDITIPTYKEDILKALKYSTTQGHFKRLKHELYKKDGSKIYVETSFTMLPNKQEIVLIINNLQYEKELELLNSSLEYRIKFKTKELEQLNQILENRIKDEVEKNREKDLLMFQQARLASMGEMIGNIAHQWRQPISAVMALVQSIEFRNRIGKLDDEFIKDKTSEALTIIKKMSHTIDDFRNFFSQTKKKDQFNIAQLFEENLLFLNDTFKGNSIEVIKNINSNIAIEGYKNEVSHSFLNILSNAKDALIENNIGNVKRYIFVDINDTPTSIIITIKDNAGGIKNDYITKIFDPYFTTKHQSHGTGIGLYMTKQIIEKNMSGKISVSNVSYEYNNHKYTGAEFIIEFKL